MNEESKPPIPMNAPNSDFPAPKPRLPSPKKRAKAYMEGRLTEADYATGGGIARVMRMADSAESDIASLQALQMLAKLAELEYDADEVSNQAISILPIHRPDNKVIVMEQSA